MWQRRKSSLKKDRAPLQPNCCTKIELDETLSRPNHNTLQTKTKGMFDEIANKFSKLTYRNLIN